MTEQRYRYDEVDVSSWQRAHEEMLGTKPKRWLFDPDAETYWLMKDVTFNRLRSRGSAHRTTQVVSAHGRPSSDSWSSMP
ncbi:MAG: hypothetical protein RIE08_07135 [Acidimicrobiales bacterium]